MEFSPLQAQALDKVGQWLKERNKPYFYLAGYAGTGKTTLAKYLASMIGGNVLFAAFTGKAASVLRKAGCENARTLHSILYSSSDDVRKEKVKELRRTLATVLSGQIITDGDQKAQDKLAKEIKEEIAALKKEIKGPIFSLNDESELREADLLVLDECSMINTPLANDTLYFNKPVLVLGDPAQLPPVQGAGYFTQNKPDHVLTEIHRQAADNPIIKWATMVREGERLPFADEGRVRKVRRGTIDFDSLPMDVQVLTGKNAVRRNLNIRIRRSQGRDGELPVKGDKLVCLKNNHELGLLNGVIGYAMDDALRIDDECISMGVLYEGMALPDVAVAGVTFERYSDPEAETDFIDRYLEQFDYGYALTVHKSQGSQWEDVILADDGFGAWDPRLRRKWLYTAITRASERMTIVA